ncbi:hypothetical protein [Thermococcus sp.]
MVAFRFWPNILNKKYGEKGVFLFIHMIILEYILPVLQVFGMVAFPSIIILQNFVGLRILDINLPIKVILFVFFLVLSLQYLPGIVMSSVAVAIERGINRAITYIPAVFLYYLIYNPFLSLAKIDGMMRFFRGVVQSW